MKWDIDKAILALEPETAAGTIFSRTLMDVSVMEREGIKPTLEEREAGCALVWTLCIGKAMMPKAFFYGRTIRGAFLRARKAAKVGKLFAPWGEKVEVRMKKSGKSKKVGVRKPVKAA